MGLTDATVETGMRMVAIKNPAEDGIGIKRVREKIIYYILERNFLNND